MTATGWLTGLLAETAAGFGVGGWICGEEGAVGGELLSGSLANGGATSDALDVGAAACRIED